LGIRTDDSSSPDEPPSNEELIELVSAQRGLIQAQKHQIEQQASRIKDLEAEIDKLKDRLGRNPRNSDVPPSSEGLAKPPANRAGRRAQKRRQGKQPGSEGRHLAQVAHPDEVVTHLPSRCRSCDADLAGGEVSSVETRQVFEVPEIKAHVTEHRMLRLRCRCGALTKAPAPKEATAATCYGPRIRALAVYLSVYQHVPYERLAEMFSDLLQIPVSSGAVVAMVAEAGSGDGLGLFEEVVKDLICGSPVAHFDETGARVEGSLHWIHVASNRLYTLLTCHKRRGKDAIEQMGVLTNMTGTAVHVVHALCNAHHLSELEALTELEGQDWAGEMIDLLLDAKQDVERAIFHGARRLDHATMCRIRFGYQDLWDKGCQANEADVDTPQKWIRATANRLLKRLGERREDVLRFTVDFNVPFDNNQAERDIRMVKLQQKISGSWRTKAGADHFCAIRSYVSTMKKHGHDVLDGLHQLFDGRVWLPGGT
jgi:transposase